MNDILAGDGRKEKGKVIINLAIFFCGLALGFIWGWGICNTIRDKG
ncbi:MAG: hypothetical protein Q8J68_14555 [Methanolobus sp.]|nr:hypothetical protein [Methanolobus sp.]MDP2218495.1 hypothetical protein [Methanolobus sp.]